jgi:hypothetical protein
LLVFAIPTKSLFFAMYLFIIPKVWPVRVSLPRQIRWSCTKAA